jgi:phytanoyl-CoA hydroxylase
MIRLNTPRGLSVDVPEILREDPSERFRANDVKALRQYYDTHGYVIIENLIDGYLCDEIRRLWDKQVKPYSGYMYRQATARAETHVFNKNGWVMNPILNLQSVHPGPFSDFRNFATDRILTSPSLASVFSTLLGDTPKIVQSMYFEGNSATWEHQDSYYLDSERPGEMSAAWIAVEDISARAGRFFICPGSHRIKLDDHNLYNNIAENHEGYISSVVARVKEERLEIRAPLLEQGDVLFWNSWTIHGSLDSQDPEHSRSSITCHAIPRSRRFLQLQTRVLNLKSEVINGVDVYRPKDLRSIRNRLVFFMESRFPRAFYWLKNRAILYYIRSKSGQSTRPPRDVLEPL